MSDEQGLLRHQAPYWHTFNTHTKQRWYGRRILDVLVEEFRDRTKHYYTWAIRKGLLRINGKPVSPSYVLQNGDLITHSAHKHEPPITSDPVRILHRDDKEGRLVVVKPGSVPVHPAGRYMRHTLLELIKSDFGITKVHTANRLDRLTSGIMVASTTSESAKKIGKAFEAGRVRKSYVCRVRGMFPEEEMASTAPLLSLDRQTGIVIGHPAGKEAKTIFNRLSYDPETDTSVLFCRPVTGRTHQIRVHAQLLGHPVANDPLYSHPIWDDYPAISLAGIAVPSTSEQAEKQARTAPDVDLAAIKYLYSHPSCAAIIEALKNAKDEGDDFSRVKDEVRFAEWNQREGWTDVETVSGINSAPAQGGDNVPVDHALGYCEECHLPLLPDPPAESLFIYLHAIRYETDDWSYEDEMPWWACDDWKQPNAALLARQKRERGEAVRPPHLKLFSESEYLGTSPSDDRTADSTAVSGQSGLEETAASERLPRLCDPQKTVCEEHKMLLEFPCSRPAVSDPPTQNATSTHPVVLETFRGIEDYTVQDFLTRVGGQGEALHAGIRTALHSSHVIVPPCLAGHAIAQRLPFVYAEHMYLASTRLPEDLLDDLLGDRRVLGTVKESTKNRKEKKARKKASKSIAETGEQLSQLAVGDPGRNLPQTSPKSSSPHEAQDEPVQHAVARTSDGSVASEARLIQLIENLWRSNLCSIATAIKSWEQRMLDLGKLQIDQGWTFRTSVDRSAYQFPTLITSRLERVLGEVVWDTLNGKVGASDNPPHPVSLTTADLDVELRFVPWLDCQDSTVGQDKLPKRMIKRRGGGTEKVNLTQCWESNPPGSLVLMIKLNAGPAQDLPQRPSVDNDLTDGGTSFARFRAYSLASMLPLPVDTARTESTLRIWEPCVGTGAIAIELAEALREKGLRGEIFGSDIEEGDIASARKISAMSRWPEDVTQEGVTIKYKHLDLRDESATTDWIGTESLDGIVTDLPWGRRVLNHGALQVLYLEFVQACIRLLKPYAFTLALTLEHRSLMRAARQAESLMRRRGGKWKMELVPLSLEVNDGASDLIASVNRQGQRQAGEMEGVRPVEMGLKPCVCLMRKTPL